MLPCVYILFKALFFALTCLTYTSCLCFTLDAGYEFDICYTSVLKRAIRTLWFVLDSIDQMWLPVHRTWRLNERHYGGLTGLNKAETAAKHGEAQVKIWRRSFDIPPPPMDEGHDFYQAISKVRSQERSEAFCLSLTQMQICLLHQCEATSTTLTFRYRTGVMLTWPRTSSPAVRVSRTPSPGHCPSGTERLFHRSKRERGCWLLPMATVSGASWSISRVGDGTEGYQKCLSHCYLWKVAFIDYLAQNNSVFNLINNRGLFYNMTIWIDYRC